MSKSLRLQAAMAAAMMQNPGMLVGDPIIGTSPKSLDPLLFPTNIEPIGGTRKVGNGKAKKKARKAKKQNRKSSRKK